MKTISKNIILRAVYTDVVSVDFHAYPGSPFSAYLHIGSAGYSFQNMDAGDPVVTAEVQAPAQLDYILQGGNYRVIVTPREPSEFNVLVRDMDPTQ